MIREEMLKEIIERLLECYKASNKSAKEIADFLEDIDEVNIAYLHITAVTKGETDLANKIEEAMDIITERKINKFREAIKTGSLKEFLKGMTYTEKISFLMDIKYSNLNEEEKQELIRILDEAREQALLEEAHSKGFETIEEWREYNRREYDKEHSKRSLTYKPLSDYNLIDL